MGFLALDGKQKTQNHGKKYWESPHIFLQNAQQFKDHKEKESMERDDCLHDIKKVNFD